MGNKSARLRHPAEGRLISPPHLPIRTPEGRYLTATSFYLKIPPLGYARESRFFREELSAAADHADFFGVCGSSL